MKGLTSLGLFVLLWVIAIVITAGIAIIPLGLLLAAIFIGSQARGDKALARVSSTLMASENLLEVAIQHRVFALWSRRAILAISDSRVLVIKRGLLGGFKMQDIQWKDLEDVTIEENVLSSMCGSNLNFKHLNHRVGLLEVNGIDSGVAPTIYAKAQFEEQAWEEKRRIRGIEEVRAAAGGVVVHTAAPQQTNAAEPRSGNRILDEIQKAKELLDMGAVSDAEFQEMKSKILGAA